MPRCPRRRPTRAERRVWKDGTQALVFELQELISWLMAMVSPPRFQQLRYFGVLSSHASLRREVVPRPPDDDAHQPASAEGDHLKLFGADLHRLTQLYDTPCCFAAATTPICSASSTTAARCSAVYCLRWCLPVLC